MIATKKAIVNGLNQRQKPARLWHDGWKENNEAELRKEKPVEDPPIIQPSGRKEDTFDKKFTQKFQNLLGEQADIYGYVNLLCKPGLITPTQRKADCQPKVAHKSSLCLSHILNG